jgi:Ca2+-binding RTX toxin-like protein
MDQFLHAEFGERALLAEGNADVIEVQDTAEITNVDLKNVSGLEVFDLTATTNGAVEFTFDFSSMTVADFDRLVGGIADTLLIRATESLNVASASTLNLILPVGVAGLLGGFAGRITIEESAELNVFITDAEGTPIAANGIGTPGLRTALFFTPNADDLDPVDGQTVVAFELSDVQAADRVVGDADSAVLFPTFESAEKIDFRFGLANRARSMQRQLNDVSTEDVDVFDFNPGAVNQAVEFDSLFGGILSTIAGLDSVLTSGGDDFMINIEQDLFVDSAAGDDTVTANDEETGGAVSLTVVSGTGSDSVIGGFLADSVIAGLGDDTVRGRTGADTIDAGAGDDTVVAGIGNDSVLGASGDDSIEAGLGDDFVNGGNGINTDGDDTINGDAGNDSILSGEGDDSILGGAQNDLIGFGDAFDPGDDITNFNFANDFVLFESPVYVEAASVNELTVNDFVNGGTGEDTVAFTMDDDTLILNSTVITNVEQLNVSAVDDNVLTLDNSILGDSGSIRVITHDYDGSGSLTFNSESFVQGESVVFVDSDLDNSLTNSRSFGAGDDLYANDFFDPSLFVTVSGNGGADTISLGATDAQVAARAILVAADPTLDGFTSIAEFVQFNTGNDGGVGGASTGGDLVLNFQSAESATIELDTILIGTDGNVATAAAGTPPVITPGTKASGLLFDLTQRQGSFLSPAELFAVENEQLTLGGQTAFNEDDITFNGDGSLGFDGTIQIGGNNMLFLTGPARSLTDAQLTDASAIAAAINNVGVVGNGLEFGEELPLDEDFVVQQQSNQALIVQQGQTDSAVWLYVESSFNFDDPLAYTAEVGELRQLGIFDNALLTADDFLTDVGQSVVI